jgi:hypothetical protein
MKKALVVVGLLASAIVVASAGPSEAWHHGPRVFVGVGPYPYWGYPYYSYRYAYPYAYGPPPVVVQQEPPVYVEQPPAASAEAPAEPGYWYYCPPSRQYYPSVPSCSEPWIRVPARSQ